MRTKKCGDPMEHVASVNGASPPTKRRPIQFFDNDQSLARIVSEFLIEGFVEGSPGIVIATAGQRAEIIRELTARSFDVETLQHSRDLLLLDVNETLSRYIVNGQPDRQKIRDETSRLIECVQAGRANCTVRIFGQMVDLLWRDGNRHAAIRLELIWNQLAQTHTSSVICGYTIGNFYKEACFPGSAAGGKP